MDEIGLANRIQLIELNPDAIDRYVFPDFELRLCKGKERFKAQLIELFPKEERGIHLCFPKTSTAKARLVPRVATVFHQEDSLRKLSDQDH